MRSAFCSLPIEVWYPIESSGPASGVIDFETDPDHVGDTLFDGLDGSPASLDNELVDVREADIRFLLDRVLGADVLPDGISARPPPPVILPAAAVAALRLGGALRRASPFGLALPRMCQC